MFSSCVVVATEVGTSVELSLGPDGTEFGEMTGSRLVLRAPLIELTFRGVRSDRSIASPGRKCDQGVDHVAPTLDRRTTTLP